jgi:hypothetical protein
VIAWEVLVPWESYVDSVIVPFVMPGQDTSYVKIPYVPQVRMYSCT